MTYAWWLGFCAALVGIPYLVWSHREDWPEFQMTQWLRLSERAATWRWPFKRIAWYAGRAAGRVVDKERERRQAALAEIAGERLWRLRVILGRHR